MQKILSTVHVNSQTLLQRNALNVSVVLVLVLNITTSLRRNF